jgi:hypothetical protein
VRPQQVRSPLPTNRSRPITTSAEGTTRCHRSLLSASAQVVRGLDYRSHCKIENLRRLFALNLDFRLGSFAAGSFRVNVEQCPVCPETTWLSEQITKFVFTQTNVFDNPLKEPPR